MDFEHSTLRGNPFKHTIDKQQKNITFFMLPYYVKELNRLQLRAP